MNYTVEEAKTKWCPMRAKFMKVNEFTRTEDYYCIADGCMAWDWVCKSETVQFGYYETKIAPIPNYMKIKTKTNEGYCFMFQNTEHPNNVECPMS